MLIQEPLRAFSFGGGVQSVAAMVLAAQGRIPHQHFVFAHVGDDSENPATLRYLEEHVRPYMAQHGLRLHEVQRQRKDGTPDTVLKMAHRESKSFRLPMRMSRTGKPGNRGCTGDFKVKPIQKWFRGQGATAEAPGLCAVGISWDEIERVRSTSECTWMELEYPLIDLRLTRSDCRVIIREAGLPVPPKSSCWFCPFHRLQEWRRMHDQEPALFAASAELERGLNEKRASIGLTPVWLTSRSRPLDQVVTGGHRGQMELDIAVEEYSCGPFSCAAGPAEKIFLKVKATRGKRKKPQPSTVQQLQLPMEGLGC